MKSMKMTAAAALMMMVLPTQAQVKFDFDFNQRGPLVTEDHYGIFFEEINHAGDGGLYAELVRNRSFEDNAGNPDSWWALGDASVGIATDDMLNTVQGHAMRMVINAAGGGARNEGFWGINVVNGREYQLSFWLRADDAYDGVITAELQRENGAGLGSVDIKVNATREWKKYTATLRATGDDAKGWFALKGSTPGTVVLDVVSLFPPTFKNRPNGCRPDLAQMLADLHPRFMRFPGGCFIEGAYGDGSTNRFEWKKTVGPIEERPGHFNRNWWYRVSDGLGYHEMLQLSEDLGANPMFVVNIGIGHDWKIDENDLGPFIQEALDAIEYANGSATDTFYGRMRAQNGHPAPFNLKYLEIGNEQEFMLNRDDYMRRYMQFYRAIKTRWPDLHLIADSYWFDNITEPVELKDEHYYDTPDFFISNYGRYDNHSNSTTHVYVGEYAVTKDCGFWGNLNAAIGEAVFMQGSENNSEAVTMMSYAPIFTNEDDYRWRPDMIRFNASLSYGTPSYYVQRMFSNNIGKQNIRWTETGNQPSFDPIKGTIGLGTWVTGAQFSGLQVVASDTTFVGENLNIADWTTRNGTWALSDTIFRQTNSSASDVTCVLNRLFTTTNVDMTVHATKKSGSEGFLIIFDYKDEQNYAWLNLGGWGNSKHGVEQCKNGVKSTLADKEGKLVNNKMYTIRVRKEGQRVRCYLDGELIIDTQLKDYAGRQVFASANIDDEAGIFYVKLVNPNPIAAPVTLSFKNGRSLSGEAEVLTAPNGTDENNIWNPFYITPKTQNVTVESDGTVSFNVAAYSVNVLRLRVPDVGEPVVEPLPAPRLRYSFDGGTTFDDSGNYKGQLQGKAAIVQQADGNYVLSTGLQGESSYMNIPVEAVQNALAGATDYTISLNVLQRIENNTNSYSWAFDVNNGTGQYFGLINAGGNSNWYCELQSGSAKSTVDSWSCLRIGEWHNITYTQQGMTARLYVDGQLRNTKTVDTGLISFVNSLKTASIGHSPFGADPIMEHALFDDLQIFDTALSEMQVRNIAAQATAMTDDGRFDGIADMQDFANLVKEVKNYYKDADDEDLTQAYNAASRAISSGTQATKQKRYEQLVAAVDAYQQGQLDLALSGLPANLTFLITNSSFTRYNVGWQGLDVPAYGSTYTGYVNEATEMFSRGFDIWQELPDMPAGVYELTASAFYRAGAIEAAYNAWKSDDPTTRYAELYLGEASEPIVSLYSCPDYTYDPYNYPDNLTAAAKALGTSGQYDANSVTYTLETAGQPLRIGLRKLKTVPADWVAYDHFQLHYKGSATGIANVTPNVQTPAKGIIYNLAGQRVVKPTRGIYIIDGKKVMVK